MAASCLGNFGTYKYTYNAQRQQEARGYLRQYDQYQQLPLSQPETVWVTKRYTPTDLRVSAPVPRHKPIAADVKTLPVPESHWLTPREPSPWAYTREIDSLKGASSFRYSSHPSTRSEEWSTLRQMLPSSGSPSRHRPPNWGTGYAPPPSMESRCQNKFPHVNSPMTRYVDDMHLTNRLYKLH